MRAGDSATIIAQSSTAVSTLQINWSFNGITIVSNGQVVQPTGKFQVTLNQTIFTLTVNQMQNLDFGVYTLTFIRIPTLVILNATINELSVESRRFKDENLIYRK